MKHTLYYHSGSRKRFYATDQILRSKAGTVLIVVLSCELDFEAMKGRVDA